MKKSALVIVVIALVAMAGSAMAAGSATIGVSATVLGTCTVVSNGTIAYTLDPAVGGDVNGTVTAPQIWCSAGTPYTITDDNGLYESGTTYRMQSTTLGTPEYIPYELTYTKTGTGAGAATNINLGMGSVVRSASYAAVTPDIYTDTVTLTINP